MKLLLRDDELTLLHRQWWMAQTKGSRMTLLSGPHGSGKTTLAAEAYRNERTLYFALAGKTDAFNRADWIAQTENILGASVPGNAKTLPALVDYLMYLSEKDPFTLILDDAQLLTEKDFEAFRDSFKLRRNKTHLNLLLLCSNKIIAERLASRDNSPLIGILDLNLQLGPFKTEQLKEAFGTSGEDLLAAFMTTGGMPGRVAWLKNTGAKTKQEIYDAYFQEDCPFLREEEHNLYRILGKNSEVYLSILQLLAQGLVSQAELEDKLGGIIIGGHLAKLEKDYELVRKCRPMLAGPASRGVVRYELSDPGLRFWLRNADALRADLELGRLDVLKKHALKDFKQEAKTALREWFLRKFQQESGYKEIGGEWAPVSAGPTTEIDILGFPPRAKRVLVGSVALRPEDFAKEPFLEKVASLRKGSLKEYVLDARLFTLGDM
ncbi:MAG: ATP-binding protein [Bacteroidales bacterium]|nr:ATP-binding protein [Bacteroidales bacterium]